MGLKFIPWGSDIVQYEDEYYKYLFYDYDYTQAPIYLWPFTPTDPLHWRIQKRIRLQE